MLELREKEILSTLKKLSGLNFVVIGGYAVNAYAQPRFSVDCDIVVLNKEDAEKIKAALMDEDYAEKELNIDLPYIGEFLCMVKRIDDYTVPFDILIGNVIDRKTGIRFPAEWIFKNSTTLSLMGKSIPLKIQLKVANPEILMVMKLAAGRKSDLRDVFMLLEKDIDAGFVLSELKKYGLEGKLTIFREFVTSKSFKDSLQGVFGKIDAKAFSRIIDKIDNMFSFFGV